MWCVVWDSCCSLEVNCNCDMSSDICNLINNCYSKKLKSQNNLFIIPHSFLPHTSNLNISLQIMKQNSSRVSCHRDSADNEAVFGSNLPYAPFIHDVICRQENFFMFLQKLSAYTDFTGLHLLFLNIQTLDILYDIMSLKSYSG